MARGATIKLRGLGVRAQRCVERVEPVSQDGEGHEGRVQALAEF